MTFKSVLMQKLGEFWAKHPEIEAVHVRRASADFFPPRVTIECHIGSNRLWASHIEEPGDDIGSHYEADRLVMLLGRELAKVTT